MAYRVCLICVQFMAVCMILYAKKTVIMAVGRNLVHKPSMFIANQSITWVDYCKYLGVSFRARANLVVDVVPMKRRFYAALNSVFSRNSALVEPVKLHLVRSFCLPLLVYCLGALDLTTSMVQELGVCWNDAFRKIFSYDRWESVKLLQFFCGCLDFTHIYFVKIMFSKSCHYQATISECILL
mgnify:CR=1 FL=1